MADKFQYTTEFQESILKYTVKNQDGYKALRLYEPEYFDLIEHQAIAHTIKLNFSQYKTIPSSPTTLKELCNDLYQRREWSKAITKEDKTRIGTIFNHELECIKTSNDNVRLIVYNNLDEKQ